jgi:xanthine dehydrogenase YagS FAD-binding subunit
MNPFTYARPDSIADAVRGMVAHPGARFIAGGTNLVDLMKEAVARPTHLIDITRLPLRQVQDLPDGGTRVGALVSNTELAYHPRIARRYPLVAQAILAGASPQLRNMATLGGNLLQRTRCLYFYDVATPCNKRQPGTGCAARTGCNRNHAILGASEHCIATHPSDLCVALAALAAVVRVTGPRGERALPFAELHRLPGGAPEQDTNLDPDELITAVDLPAQGFADASFYLKLRDRASYAFALVSVAAALELDGQGVVRQARIALGGVAHKPWREPEAEALLIDRPAAAEHFVAAAQRLVRDARGLAGNSFKIELTKRAVVRALLQAATGAAGASEQMP